MNPDSEQGQINEAITEVLGNIVTIIELSQDVGEEPKHDLATAFDKLRGLVGYGPNYKSKP